MRKAIVITLLALIFVSCSRSMTPWQAAQSSQRCGRGSVK